MSSFFYLSTSPILFFPGIFSATSVQINQQALNQAHKSYFYYMKDPAPSPKKHAILSVWVDKEGNMNLQFGGQPFELQMLGALDMAKDFLKEHKEKRSTINNTNKMNLMNDGKFRKKVSKKEAIDFYLHHFGVVKERMKAISDSCDKAEFDIDPQLHDKF